MARLADWHEEADPRFAGAVERMAEKLVANSRDLSAGKHAARV